MNYKKLGVYAFLFLMLSVSFVSAAGDIGIAVQEGINNVAEIISPITNLLFGKPDKVTIASGGNAMNILAFLLVMLVIYGVLSPFKMFGDKEWVNAGIAFIIAVIGVRFMPVGFLETLTTPASALVALIVLGIPMIILFFLAQKLSVGVQRMLWTAYAVLVLVLMLLNWNKAGLLSFYWVYLIIIAVCIAMIKWGYMIHKFWNKGEMLNQIEDVDQTSRAQVLSEIKALQAQLASATGNQVAIIKGKITYRKKLLASM